MFNRLLEDLRFIVGSLFGVIGAILLVVAGRGDPTGRDALHLNLMSGTAMAVFAAVMVAMAVRAARPDAGA